MKTALAFIVALSVAGCQHAASGPSAARSIAPACGEIRDWEPDFQKKLAAELGKLSPDHPIWRLARDAIAARDAIRICRGQGVPKATVEAIVAEIRRKSQ